jgi:hypothetical protein
MSDALTAILHSVKHMPCYALMWMKSTSGASIPGDSVFHGLPYDTVLYDPMGMLGGLGTSTAHATAPIDGIYLVRCDSGSLPPGVNYGQILCSIFKNGIEEFRGTNNIADSTAGNYMLAQACAPILLRAGDTVSAAVWTSSGSTQTLVNATGSIDDWGTFEIALLRPI